MRNLLLLLFCTSLFAQNVEQDNFLIIEGESPNYYYVLTKEGYYVSKSSEEYTFYNYTKPIPSSINVSLSTLRSVTHNNKTYLLYPGGGLLYLFNNGAIERIDRSFPHRNQYGSYFFSYKNNLFLIGGYGFWETKSIITKFNFNSGDWEIVTASGQSPDGLDQGTYFQKGNNLYVFDFLSRSSNSQKEKRHNNLFVLNLESLIWSKLGVINELIKPINQIDDEKRFFNFDNKLLISYSENPEFFIADLEKNTIEKHRDEALFYKTSGRSIQKNNKLIGAVKNSVTNELTIRSFDLESSMLIQTDEISYFFRGTKELLNYLYLSLSLLIVIIIVLSIYYKKVSNTYLLDQNTLSISSSSVELNEIERTIIKMFSQKKLISNSNLMDLFIEESKTKDFAVKKKNRVLDKLEDKLNTAFKIEFIYKEKTKTDSRQLTYRLNKKIRIVDDLNV